MNFWAIEYGIYCEIPIDLPTNKILIHFEAGTTVRLVVIKYLL